MAKLHTSKTVVCQELINNLKINYEDQTDSQFFGITNIKGRAELLCKVMLKCYFLSTLLAELKSQAQKICFIQAEELDGNKEVKWVTPLHVPRYGILAVKLSLLAKFLKT